MPPHLNTTAVPRLLDDVKALMELLTDFDLPPLRVVRPSSAVHVYLEMHRGANSAQPSRMTITWRLGHSAKSRRVNEV